jgi:hypothetical protein
MSEFNYCIGSYWEGNSGSIGVYAYGSEVHYGTIEDATSFLEYVKKKYPGENYQIFKVVPIDN